MKSIKKSFNFLILFVAAIVTLSLLGCEDSSPVEPGASNATKIEGRVVGNGGFSKLAKTDFENGLEGATVTVAKVEANGSLTVVSKGSVQTDAQGKFVIDVESQSTNHLVVIAAKGTSQWKAVVTTTARSSSTAYCAPVNDETTAEADIYAQVVSRSKADVVAYSDIQSCINADVAARIKGNASLTSQVTTSVIAYAEAKAKAQAHSYFGLSAMQINAIKNAELKAQGELESALYFANDNQANIDAAFGAYTEATVDAYVNNSSSAETCAKVIDIGIQTLVNVSANLSSELKLALIKSISIKRAQTCSDAVGDEFESSGGSQSNMTVLVSAEINLLVSINAASSYSQITDAFAQFNSVVVEQFKLILSAHANAITTVNTSINSSGGPKTILSAAVSTTANADVVLNAYVTFYNSVSTMVESSLSAASSAQIESTSEVLILSNSTF
ncbi:MAG: hypothetical protein HYS25_07160 [Ignavibacteriales bacterium]|nr:hypothetical protein [Ignavibacteriales bacterium]